MSKITEITDLKNLSRGDRGSNLKTNQIKIVRHYPGTPTQHSNSHLSPYTFRSCIEQSPLTAGNHLLDHFFNQLFNNPKNRRLYTRLNINIASTCIFNRIHQITITAYSLERSEIDIWFTATGTEAMAPDKLLPEQNLTQHRLSTSEFLMTF